jgi:uncharacterized protein YwqG
MSKLSAFSQEQRKKHNAEKRRNRGAEVFKDIQELREKLKVFGLERHEEKIVALAKPAIRMLPKRVEDDEIPIGASKLGGNPDLPEDFGWKMCQGKPLTFVGQFKLSELAPYDRDKELPAEGMLYYFCDIWKPYEGFDAQHLVYFDMENIPLVRRLHPQVEALHGMIQALPAHRLDFESKISLPIFFGASERLGSNLGIDFDGKEGNNYWDLYKFDSASPKHHFLGYSSPVQNPIESPLDRLLFQIDSDDSLNLMWGDVGIVYVCILKTSLSKKQFGGTYTWTEMQCY